MNPITKKLPFAAVITSVSALAMAGCSGSGSPAGEVANAYIECLDATDVAQSDEWDFQYAVTEESGVILVDHGMFPTATQALIGAQASACMAEKNMGVMVSPIDNPDGHLIDGGVTRTYSGEMVEHGVLVTTQTHESARALMQGYTIQFEELADE